MGHLRRTAQRERVITAMVFYGLALLLLALACLVGRGEAGQYLFDGGLIAAGSATGMLLSSLRRQRPQQGAAVRLPSTSSGSWGQRTTRGPLPRWRKGPSRQA